MNRPRFKHTPDWCDQTILNEPQEIFVFGSNTQGIHGAGSALTAKKEFGALEGIPSGLVGRSYGIITKDFRGFTNYSTDYHREMLSLIRSQVHTLYKFAELRKELHFYVTRIGCDRAGFSVTELQSICRLWKKPLNIILPKAFH